MELSNQIQKAGDNSTQVQAGVVNYVTNITTGIDELRAREIFKEEYAVVAQNWTSEALSVANGRVQALEDKVLYKFVEIDKTLRFFSDPAFQFTLRQAQQTAAASDKDYDIDLLADLLVHCVEEKGDRKRVLGISKAIEVVDKIDYQALVGLSVMYAMSMYIPKSSFFLEGLATLDKLYGKLIGEFELPTGLDWLNHLDLLSAIRIHPAGISQFKKIDDYFVHKLQSYFSVGLKTDSELLSHIKSEFSRVHIPLDCLIEHPYRKDFVYLNAPSNVDAILLDSIDAITGKRERRSLNQEQKDVLQNAIKEMHKVDNLGDKVVQEYFLSKWNSFSNLKKCGMWWNAFPIFFSITPLGVALANAYNKTKYSAIPCLY